MRKQILYSMAVLQFALAPTLANAQPLDPVGPWNVNYADNECRLTRSFGVGDNEVGLRIARGASLNRYDIIIAGKNLPKSTVTRDFTLTTMPANITANTKATPYLIKDTNLRLWRWLDLEDAFVQELNDQQQLSFSGREMDLQLKTPGLKNALDELKKCHDDLLTSKFNLDVVALRTLSRHPEPASNPALWILTDDYPRDARKLYEMGTTNLSLQVGADGKPTGCNILVSSGSKLLDKASCDLLMQRAEFRPAEDKNGNAVASLWLRNVRWDMYRHQYN